MQAFVTKV